LDIGIFSEFENKKSGLYYNHAIKTNQPNDIYEPHFHNMTEIIFFKSGNISYFTDGKKYRLTKDMLVLSRPGDIHYISVEGDEEYERYNILFDEKNLPFNIYEKIPADTDVIDFEKNTNISNIFKKMDYYCEVLEGPDLNRMLTNLIEEVFYNIIIESKNVPASNSTQTNPIISKAIDYIEKNLMTLICVEEIANELYVTKSHLHHLFIKHLKMSPKKYINIKRLTVAKRELYSGSKATDVCTKCGFSDYSAFYRAYKKQFGHSPSDISSVTFTNLNSDKILRKSNDGI
jgi:AraC-like DNA-binding protein